jgi:predicted permease
MELFEPILNQMVYLFLLIAIGYILVRLNALPTGSASVLSRLESKLFIPSLALATFMNNFTVERLSEYGVLLLLSFALFAVVMPLAMLFARLIYGKDEYLKKIATYGLSFANFGYMGNAVMSAIFPEIFLEYSIFCMPLWIMIYVWGIPALLISGDGKTSGIMGRIKPLLNPMFAAMLVGAVIGLSGLTPHIPASVKNVVEVSGNCMSPIAMLLTGMTVAESDLKKMLTAPRTYLLSAIRLLAFPIVFILIFALIPKGDIINNTFLISAVAALSMPLGLNTIVVPKGYGKDTTDAAGMALISHTLSIGTIPLIFLIMNELLI